MVKIIVFIVILTAYAFCYQNPNILKQIALASQKSGELEGDPTSCYNSVFYLLKTITETDVQEIKNNLNIVTNDLRSVTEFENDIKNKINA